MNEVMSPNPNQTSQDPTQQREHADRLGNLANSKPAQINREIGLNLFKDMTLGRRFEDKCAEMYYRGKMFGFVHLYAQVLLGQCNENMTGFVVPTEIMFML